MRFCFSLCLLLVLGIPLHAQSEVYSQNLSALDIQAIQITRSESDALVLEIEAIAEACGEIVINQWYTEVIVDSLLTPLVGDLGRASSGQQYANISIFILPEEERNCDLETPHSISIEMPTTIEMLYVPDYRDDGFHDTVLLVNDFAAWFYLANESVTSPNGGQAINIGETDLIRWEKIDSVVEDLYSLGANPGSAIPWIQGYHPDGCEAVSHVNFILDPVENNTYTADIFRLFPMDSACSSNIQPFVITATGVVPQNNITLNLGETAYAILGSENIVTPIQRRYPIIVNSTIQATDDGLNVQLIIGLSENCDAPINIEQSEINNIVFLSLYYDVTEDVICTNEEITLEEHIIVPSLPLVINGISIFQ